jgi:phage terminase large subunit GpA-like protein
MACLSDVHPCKRVVAKCASQMMKTQIALNWLGSTIHQSPSNFLWLVPTGKLHKRSAGRIDKTFAAVPVLKERVAPPHSRDAMNNMDTKEYIGGTLFIATAGAAANLSEVPARRVYIDEVDRTEANVNGEGDPIKLAEARQTTFDRNRKLYCSSSPTIEGESKIDDLYQQGTRREALAECVHCGHMQTLEFERLRMSEDGQNAIYPCAECGGVMYEPDKTRMFAKGAWTDGGPGDGETESFTISAMFLPYGWFPWKGLIKEHSAAKVALEQGDESAMITFYNTRLARCWERQKEQTKYDELMARAEDYRLGTVPAGGLKLSASIDTQSDRLELKVVAWGEGLECWIVDYQIILQSPAEEATWERADALLSTKYKHESGNEMGIAAAFVDSGGHATQEVYNFTYSRRRRHIYAIKGASKPNRPILPAKPSLVDMTRKGETVKKGAQLWHVGTDTAKDYLAARWKKASGHGAVHFSTDLPEDYYKQLTSEYRTTGYKRGMKTSWWEKKQQDRNEALDLMVYNLAAAHYLGLHKYKPGHWKSLREKLIPAQAEEVKPEPVPEVFPDYPPAENKRVKARPRRRGFVKRW